MSVNKSLKRINKDIANIIRDKSLQEQNKIFCLFNDKDIYDVKALIVGPKDTPYEGGFFFFALRFNNEHPKKPPTALMKTLSPSVRFNPNLYEQGRVCLSIIGTWQGPSWTPCMSMTTVLTSIQSLMSEMPYRNEPHHENDDNTLCHQYNDCIEYHTYRVAIIGMIKNPAKGFEEFRPIVEKQFVKDFDRYSKIIKKLRKEKQGKKVTAPSPFSNMKADCDYASLEAEMNQLYERLSVKYADVISAEAELKIKSEKSKGPQSELAKKIASQKTIFFK